MRFIEEFSPRPGYAGGMRAHVLVSGKVQGVFFRDSTRERAADVGVKGFVRNLSDGRVEAVFEGTRSAVEDMVAFCRRGPARARVASVEVTWLENDGSETEDFGAFDIRGTAQAPMVP